MWSYVLFQCVEENMLDKLGITFVFTMKFPLFLVSLTISVVHAHRNLLAICGLFSPGRATPPEPSPLKNIVFPLQTLA